MDKQISISRSLVWLSFLSLSLLFSVMLLGVYISSSHQGLSCPDWPLCPNGFNLPPPEYFFEHVHRTLVIVTGILIFVTTLYSIKRNVKNVKKPAIIACILVIIQILMGMLVVNSKLHAILVAIHLSTGILLFSALLMTFLFSYRNIKKSILF